MSGILCSRPECQTTAGCLCGREPYRPFAIARNIDTVIAAARAEGYRAGLEEAAKIAEANGLKPQPLSAKGETPEIEVTPEMLEAGAEALTDYDDCFDDPQEGAERVFREMLKAWHRGR